MLLVSGATKTVYRYSNNPYIGVLMVPGAGNDLDKIPPRMKVAADNGAYAGLDAPSFVKMLERLKGHDVLWVTCPDVWGDCETTRQHYDIWSPLIRHYGLPVAYVLQDNEKLHRIPWDDIACLFVGGSDEWRVSEEATKIYRYAKSLGKWLHLGRVNSLERIQFAQGLGFDSVDGTGFSIAPDEKIPKALSVLKNEQTWLGVIQC